MKFLLFLLSIYLLALGCLPCADKECAEAGTIVEAKAMRSNDCHSDEVCSPFCICACCSIHITTANSLTHSTAPLQKEITVKQATHLYQPLINGANNSIWQPPRLG